MSRAIREAIKKVQVLSNLRGLYLDAIPDYTLGTEFGIQDQDELLQLRSRGANVRFVFREENFG